MLFFHPCTHCYTYNNFILFHTIKYDKITFILCFGSFFFFYGCQIMLLFPENVLGKNALWHAIKLFTAIPIVILFYFPSPKFEYNNTQTVQSLYLKQLFVSATKIFSVNVFYYNFFFNNYYYTRTLQHALKNTSFALDTRLYNHADGRRTERKPTPLMFLIRNITIFPVNFNRNFCKFVRFAL